MDHSFREGVEENSMESKAGQMCDAVEESAVLFPTPQKLGGLGNHNLDLKFASQTPDKLNVPLVSHSKEGEAEVPERFVHVVELFEGVMFASRLLALQKKSPTFQNISTQVHVLTKRELSYFQLAQMKYILPEAIQIEKILVHDKSTLCMKPDMKIVLHFDGREGKPDWAALLRTFASNLANYIVMHPKAADIPLGLLPDPFNQNKQAMVHQDSEEVQDAIFSETPSSPAEFQPTFVQDELPLTLSHLSPLFKSRFSREFVSPVDEKTQGFKPLSLFSTQAYCTMDKLAERKENRQSWGLSQSDCSSNLEVKVPQPKEYLETHPEFEVEPLNSDPSASPITGESHLSKLYPVANDLTVTPENTIPKRPMVISDVKNHDVGSHSKTCHQPVKRSLDFLESDVRATLSTTLNKLDCPVQFQQVISQTVDGLVQPVQHIQSAGVKESDTEINLKHRQTSEQFRELVSLIHSIFRLVNYSPITKEELAYKILVNSFDFDERKEVDEHIEVLEKLVPDWIFNKLTPSGDLMYNINKMMDVGSVCARITSV